jgi:hypothetical protein
VKIKEPARGSGCSDSDAGKANLRLRDTAVGQTEFEHGALCTAGAFVSSSHLAHALCAHPVEHVVG